MEHRRFVTPKQGEQFASEYDFPTDELTDLQGRDIAPVFVISQNLAVAGTLALPNLPGRGFVPYFFVTGTVQKQRQPGGLLTVYVNQLDSSQSALGVNAKHNRGFRGSFAQLFLSWPAQPGVSVDLVIHRSKFLPWMTDDIDASAATVFGAPANTLATNGNASPAASYNVIFATGPGTIALPNANAFLQAMAVVNVGGGLITVQLGSGNLDGQASLPLTNTGDSFTVVSDGVNGWTL